MYRSLVIGTLMVLGSQCLSSGEDSKWKLSDEAATARLFPKLRVQHRKITTESEDAQAYFDQGLTWMYAFNHDEAIRCFARAAELDKDCAMAWWGASICYGPQYNLPLEGERALKAWQTSQQALKRIERTTPVERALIEALQLRTSEGEFVTEEQAARDKAYAAAMEKIWKDNSNDPDVGTLYAEAMMVLRPWKLYTTDGEPAQDTPKIVATLERVIALDCDHPGALHYYIHAVEPSQNPENALFAANRLSDLVPASGHLLHMPCHIYVQTGYWDRAIDQSIKAMKSDDEYRKLVVNPGVQHGYMIHNSHMLAFAAMMSGRKQDALAAARDMWDGLTDEVIEEYSEGFDHNMCAVFDVYKRFGEWQAILDEDPPPESLPLTQATWRASRAVACANLGDFKAAAFEYGKFREAYHNVDEKRYWGTVLAMRVLDVSDHFVAGEITLRKGILAASKDMQEQAEENFAQAEQLLSKAIAIEDTLGYGEPPQWLQPVRHTLGGVYLLQGKLADAERVYREDLAKWKDNIWSLEGLRQTLERQGNHVEAEAVAVQLADSSLHADFEPTESCRCLVQP